MKYLLFSLLFISCKKSIPELRTKCETWGSPSFELPLIMGDRCETGFRPLDNLQLAKSYEALIKYYEGQGVKVYHTIVPE